MEAAAAHTRRLSVLAAQADMPAGVVVSGANAGAVVALTGGSGGPGAGEPLVGYALEDGARVALPRGVVALLVEGAARRVVAPPHRAAHAHAAADGDRPRRLRLRLGDDVLLTFAPGVDGGAAGGSDAEEAPQGLWRGFCLRTGAFGEFDPACLQEPPPPPPTPPPAPAQERDAGGTGADAPVAGGGGGGGDEASPLRSEGPPAAGDSSSTPSKHAAGPPSHEPAAPSAWVVRFDPGARRRRTQRCRGGGALTAPRLPPPRAAVQARARPTSTTPRRTSRRGSGRGSSSPRRRPGCVHLRPCRRRARARPH